MVFSVSSQQQTDTQETAEDRQPVLVTSEREVQGAGQAEDELWGGGHEFSLAKALGRKEGERKERKNKPGSLSLCLFLSCGGCLFRDLLFPTN